MNHCIIINFVYNTLIVSHAVSISGMNKEMFRGFLVVAWNGAGQRVGSFTAMSNSRTACGVSCLTMKANNFVYTDLCHCVCTLMHFSLFVYYAYDFYIVTCTVYTPIVGYRWNYAHQR